MNPKLPLNEPQERRLTIVLARLEGALRQLHAEMSRPSESSRLIRYEDPIDPALAEPLVNAIGRAQIQVERMASDLDLQAGPNSIRRRHLAAFELLNIDLYSSRAKGLRGYGKVAPVTADYLETEIAALETVLEEIIRQLKGGEASQTSGGAGTKL